MVSCDDRGSVLMTDKASTLAAMKCLPKRRIQCTTGRIVVGNREFHSASEALLAYLHQFDEKQRTKKQQDAYELLLSKQGIKPNHLQRTNKIEAEIQERLRKIKLQKLNRAVDRRQNGSALRQEVEDALSRSASLLKHVNEDAASIQCVSDIGSLTTEALLSVDPYIETKRGVLTDEDGKRRHIYSYRTPRSRSRTVDSVSQRPQLSKQSGIARRTSIDSLAPAALKSQRHLTRSKPSDAFDHNRSRSVPPLPSHVHQQDYLSSVERHPRWVDDLDVSASTVTPSWVNSLDATALSEPDLTNGRIPKWVEAAENLDVSGYSDLLDDINRKKKKVLFSMKTHDNTTNTTTSLPGLNFSDLATSGLEKGNASDEIRAYSQRVMALEEERNRILNGNGNALNKSNSEDFIDSGADEPTRKAGENPYRDLMYQELSRSSQLQSTLDKYLEELDKKNSPSPHKAGRNMPRCSSMETCSSATGKVEIKSDITDASPINRHSHLSVTGVSDDLPFIPTPAKLTSRTNHRSDTILDMDRSWEQPITNLKAGVLSENAERRGKQKSPTLTGSQQPGSMEALKNMLFKLQAEESSTQGKEFSSALGHKTDPVSPISLPALKDYNFVSEPGGHSLERALVHLNRLKTLVHNGTPSTDDVVSVSSVSASTSSLLSKQ